MSLPPHLPARHPLPLPVSWAEHPVSCVLTSGSPFNGRKEILILGKGWTRPFPPAAVRRGPGHRHTRPRRPDITPPCPPHPIPVSNPIQKLDLALAGVIGDPGDRLGGCLSISPPGPAGGVLGVGWGASCRFPTPAKHLCPSPCAGGSLRPRPVLSRVGGDTQSHRGPPPPPAPPSSSSPCPSPC